MNKFVMDKNGVPSKFSLLNESTPNFVLSCCKFEFYLREECRGALAAAHGACSWMGRGAAAEPPQAEEQKHGHG